MTATAAQPVIDALQAEGVLPENFALSATAAAHIQRAEQTLRAAGTQRGLTDADGDAVLRFMDRLVRDAASAQAHTYPVDNAVVAARIGNVTQTHRLIAPLYFDLTAVAAELRHAAHVASSASAPALIAA